MLKKIIIFVVVLVMMAYIVPLSLIVFNNNIEINKPVEYLIVLGAKVNNDQPSSALAYRLNDAIDIYNKYPETKIVVTGGQGADEDYPEAEVMKNYLVNNGVPVESIVVEDKSTSTFENIINTKEIIGDSNSIGVVTNKFHAYRANMICNRIFSSKCHIQGARNPKSFQGAYSVLREPFALYKSFLLDK